MAVTDGTDRMSSVQAALVDDPDVLCELVEFTL
jgi:hypothetical protein